MQPAVDAGVRVEIGGDLAQYSMQPETKAAEALGVLAAMVLLLVTFGSVVGIGLPIGIALVGLATRTAQIGRASCRERVCQYVSSSVAAGSLKKQQTRKSTERR